MRISVSLDHKTYKKISVLANTRKTSISNEAKLLIKNGLLFDEPEIKTQTILKCTIEMLFILRELAERQLGSNVVYECHIEAKRKVKELLLDKRG